MNSSNASLTVKTPASSLQVRARAELELRSRRSQGIKQTNRGIEYTFYGQNAAFHDCRDTEFMLSGPAQTGKTITGLALLNSLAWQYPDSQWAIVRKVRADMDGSVLSIFTKKVLGPNSPVQSYGGQKVEFFDYPNGARIWVGGMDRPGKALSSERDGIYFNQAEESEIGDWETLITRTTGRSGYMHDAGGVPFGLLFGDCNPGPPTHWIWARQLAGKLKFFQSRHQDNPALYDQLSGAITEFGMRTMAILDGLTGYRKSRLRHGLWVQAEGVIFDTWSEGADGNVTEAAEFDPEVKTVMWAVDDGYSSGSAPDTRGIDPDTGQYVADAHPRAILLAQIKPDGHIDIFQENYACQKLSDVQIGEVLALGYPSPDFAVHGPGQSEIRGRLYAANIAPRKCQANVDESIKQLREKLAADKNGWRAVRVHPRCTRLRSEMVSYAYEPGTGKPVKAFDHGPDAARYLAWVIRNWS